MRFSYKKAVKDEDISHHATLLDAFLLAACSVPPEAASDTPQIAGLTTVAAGPAEPGAGEMVYAAARGATPDWFFASSFATAGNGRFWQFTARSVNG